MTIHQRAAYAGLAEDHARMEWLRVSSGSDVQAIADARVTLDIISAERWRLQCLARKALGVAA